MDSILASAHVVCFINGMPFARVASLTFGSSVAYKEIRGVDSMFAHELAPMTASVSGQMTIFKLHADGGIESAGLTATWNDLTRAKYFNLLVLDRATDTPLLNIDRCISDQQSWNFSHGTIAMGVISFKGLSWYNETPPASD